MLSGKENVNSSQDMKYTDIDYAAVLLYKCHKQCVVLNVDNLANYSNINMSKYMHVIYCKLYQTLLI